MKILDLSHNISPDMPVYPGTEPPVISNEYGIEDDGFYERKITLYSHTGTHMDAPAHIIQGSETLDEFTTESFFGKAFVLELTQLKKQLIDVADLKSHQDTLKNLEFLLLHTGWSRFWGTKKYFKDYPVLSGEAAQWLKTFHLKGIGLDTISADRADSKDFPIHKVFLKNHTLIIENLTNLDTIPSKTFLFSCFPLKFANADGSPVRAVAIIE